MTRTVRLKELGINLDYMGSPREEDLTGSDGTLLPGPFKVRTDENGFIRGKVEIGSDQKIVVLGDSVVENKFVQEGGRFTECAEARLALLGRETKVLNGGVSGASMLHILISTLTKVIPLRPEMIVVMTGVMDIDCAIDSESFWTSNPYLTPFVYGARQADPVYKASVPPNFADRGRLLGLVSQACSAFGIKLAVATIPHRGNDDYAAKRGDWFKRLSDLRQQVNESTRQHARVHGTYLIDLEREFSGRSDLFYDQFHFNDNGSALVGSAFADRLLPALNAAGASPVLTVA